MQYVLIAESEIEQVGFFFNVKCDIFRLDVCLVHKFYLFSEEFGFSEGG